MCNALQLAPVVCVLGLLCACREANVGEPVANSRREVVDPTAEDYRGPPLPRGRVVLTDAFGGAHLVEVEVAATDSSRTRGMMWRREFASGRGMLFVFSEDGRHPFWMKNTLIPLDMLFIDRSGTVVELFENAEPGNLTSRGGRYSCRYVLEVPGGWTARVGIRPGSRMELQLPPGLVVEP